MTNTASIDIEITGIADRAFPVWLSFEFPDRYGKRHYFIEKAPVILYEDDCIPSLFPKIIRLDCKVIEAVDDYVIISTLQPYDIISAGNENRFEMPSHAIHAALNADA